MPKYCSVYGCNSASNSNPELSFFQYPKDPNFLKAWVRRVRRDGFIPTSTSLICSKHFNEDDFTVAKTDTPSIFKKKRLKKGAVPSVNLRGGEIDERESKRSGRALSDHRNLRPVDDSDNSHALHEPTLVGNDSDDTVASGSQTRQDSLGCRLGATEHQSFTVPQDTIQMLRNQIKRLQSEKELLEKKCFLFKNLNDAEVKSYTGLEKPIFEIIVETMKRFLPLNYWSGKPVKSISFEDQLLILLMRLKLDLPYFDIARRYSVSQSTIQNITMTYLYAMHEIFYDGMMATLPSQEKNQCSLPDSFGDIANCRVILDCTEFRIATPRGDLQAAAAAYSNYKHNLTAKFLIGVAPNGSITFVSEAFPGSSSDKVVTDQSGIISHLKAGDLILADKGFLIHDLLPKNVFLNLPAFLCGKTKFSKNEAIFSRKIAGCRIHVERAIERLRNYKILDYASSSLLPYFGKIVQVCAVLVNFQSPIIHGVLENYIKSTSTEEAMQTEQ